jgi:hypothetical protein
LTTHGPSQNYFLEFGGERLLGNEDVDPDQFLLDLYRELVDGDTVPSVDLPVIERAFTRLHIGEKIVRTQSLVVNVKGVEDHVVFDYGYRNGVLSLMKEIQIGQVGRNPWEIVHAAVWSYDRARENDETCRVISLIHGLPTTETAGPTALLKGVSDAVVDMSNEDAATEGLAAALRLS